MESNNWQQCAALVKQAIRRNPDLSVSNLAAELGMTQGRLSQLLSPNQPDTPSWEQQAALAHALGLKPSKLGMTFSGISASEQSFRGLYIIECKLNEVIFTKVGIAKNLEVRVPQSLEDFGPYHPQLKLTLEMSVGGLVYGLEQMVSRHFSHKRFKGVVTSRECYEVLATEIAAFVLAFIKAETFEDFYELMVYDEDLLQDSSQLL